MQDSLEFTVRHQTRFHATLPYYEKIGLSKIKEGSEPMRWAIFTDGRVNIKLFQMEKTAGHVPAILFALDEHTRGAQVASHRVELGHFRAIDLLFAEDSLLVRAEHSVQQFAEYRLGLGHFSLPNQFVGWPVGFIRACKEAKARIARANSCQRILDLLVVGRVRQQFSAQGTL